MLEINVVNFESSVVAKAACLEAVFGCDYDQNIIDTVINWQLAKKRKGSASTCGISEISGTTAKPYKQKGTGRARQGSLRSPQFRGGGIIFGPKPRDYGYKINKKIRKQALRVALSYKLMNNKLFLLNSAKLEQKRTAYLRSLPLFTDIKSALIVDELIDKNLRLASRSVSHFDVLPSEGINVYDVITHENVFLTEVSLRFVEKRLGGVQSEEL